MVEEPRVSPSRLAVFWRDKWLILCSLILLWFVRVSLSLRGYNRMVSRISLDRTLPLPSPALAWRVAESIRIASRFTPRATCLVQAVAAKTLLAWRGYSSQIEVGVRKSGESFDAHAWLTTNGTVILGGDSQNLSGFHAFLKIR